MSFQRAFTGYFVLFGIGMALTSSPVSAQRAIDMDGDLPISEEEETVRHEDVMDQEQFEELERLLEDLHKSDFHTGQSAYEAQMQAVEQFREQQLQQESFQ